MLGRVALRGIERAERRLGVELDYVRTIARTDLRLLLRYNRFFGFLDPRRHLPPEAYHAARVVGALAADCGTCLEAEVNLARRAGVPAEVVAALLRVGGEGLEPGVAAVARLARAVVGDRADDPEAREAVRTAYGEAGLIEAAYAMNGAALLPGVKRAMGHAIACDADLMRRLAAEHGTGGGPGRAAGERLP